MTDGYRARNADLLRSRIFTARRERAEAQRAGDDRTAKMLGDIIKGWISSLRYIGERE